MVPTKGMIAHAACFMHKGICHNVTCLGMLVVVKGNCNARHTVESYSIAVATVWLRTTYGCDDQMSKSLNMLFKFTLKTSTAKYAVKALLQ